MFTDNNQRLSSVQPVMKVSQEYKDALLADFHSVRELELLEAMITVEKSQYEVATAQRIAAEKSRLAKY